MSPSTFVFALVVGVELLVAVVALAFAVSANFRSRSTEIEVRNSRPSKIAGEVEGLRDELAAYKRVVRSELGRVWQRMPRERVGDVIEGRIADIRPLETGDDEIDAMLALQRAPGAGPK